VVDKASSNSSVPISLTLSHSTQSLFHYTPVTLDLEGSLQEIRVFFQLKTFTVYGTQKEEKEKRRININNIIKHNVWKERGYMDMY
jgi:hypothetical protein